MPALYLAQRRHHRQRHPQHLRSLGRQPRGHRRARRHQRGDTSDTQRRSLLLDLNAADIEAGLLDNAEVVTFLVNSDRPGSLPARAAHGLDRQHHPHGRGAVQDRVARAHAGAQPRHRAHLRRRLRCGAGRCALHGGHDAVHLRPTRSRVVTSRRSSRFRRCRSTASAQVAGGKVTWTSGANTGYSMEIKEYVSLTDDALPADAGRHRGRRHLHLPRRLRQEARTCSTSTTTSSTSAATASSSRARFEILKVGKR